MSLWKTVLPVEEGNWLLSVAGGGPSTPTVAVTVTVTWVVGMQMCTSARAVHRLIVERSGVSTAMAGCGC